MRRVSGVQMVVAALVLALWAPGIGAQAQVKVTVQDLFKSNHQIAVGAGTEVVWADSHFDRVWFPAGRGAPRVQRGPEGFRAVFTGPGTYRGAFTVVMGHGTNEIYQMTVTVKEVSK